MDDLKEKLLAGINKKICWRQSTNSTIFIAIVVKKKGNRLKNILNLNYKSMV